MGNQSGFRTSEWCQPHSNKSPINRSITRNIDSSAAAFIASDVSLRDKHKHKIIFSATLDPTTVVYCDTCWRFQKDNNNSEIITYEHNDLKPTHCYIRAVLRILARADHLGINFDTFIAVAMVGTNTRKKYPTSPVLLSPSTFKQLPKLPTASKLLKHLPCFPPFYQSGSLCSY